jgi:hypothetical protein
VAPGESGGQRRCRARRFDIAAARVTGELAGGPAQNK